jgi:hypothetical protein
MTQDVRKYRDEMGETGAGIVDEAEIDMERDNAFTQSWGVSNILFGAEQSSDSVDSQRR